VTRDTLDRETREVSRDACAKLAELQKTLAGYRAALQRLKASAPMIASQREQWLKEQDEAYKNLWKDAADVMINRLDASYDEEVEVLNGKARQALRMRKNAIDAEYRDKFDAFFEDYLLQRRAVKLKKEFLVGLVMEKTSKAIDLADWLMAEERYEKITGAVRFALTNSWVVGPEIAAVAGTADLSINVVLHAAQAWESAAVLTTLEHSTDLYRRGVLTLLRKIEQARSEIDKAQAEAAQSKRRCAA